MCLPNYTHVRIINSQHNDWNTPRSWQCTTFYCFDLPMWLRSRAFVCLAFLHLTDRKKKRFIKEETNKHVNTRSWQKWHTYTRSDTRGQTQTIATDTQSHILCWRSPLDYLFMERGIRKTLAVSHFFFCYFNSPLFWCRTYSSRHWVPRSCCHNAS